MARWKGTFFQPGHWKWIKAWTVNSDPEFGQPENMMREKQAAVFKHMPNITLPPGIKPGCTYRLHAEGFPQQLWGCRMQSSNSEATQIQFPVLPPV